MPADSDELIDHAIIVGTIRQLVRRISVERVYQRNPCLWATPLAVFLDGAECCRESLDAVLRWATACQAPMRQIWPAHASDALVTLESTQRLDPDRWQAVDPVLYDRATSALEAVRAGWAASAAQGTDLPRLGSRGLTWYFRHAFHLDIEPRLLLDDLHRINQALAAALGGDNGIGPLRRFWSRAEYEDVGGFDESLRGFDVLGLYRLFPMTTIQLSAARRHLQPESWLRTWKLDAAKPVCLSLPGNSDRHRHLRHSESQGVSGLYMESV